MLRLTDSEMDLINRLATPIAVEKRPAFLAAVATALELEAGIGEGAVHRAARVAQRQFSTRLNFRRTPQRRGIRSALSSPPGRAPDATEP